MEASGVGAVGESAGLEVVEVIVGNSLAGSAGSIVGKAADGSDEEEVEDGLQPARTNSKAARYH